MGAPKRQNNHLKALMWAKLDVNLNEMCIAQVYLIVRVGWMEGEAVAAWVSMDKKCQCMASMEQADGKMSH